MTACGYCGASAIGHAEGCTSDERQLVASWERRVDAHVSRRGALTDAEREAEDSRQREAASE